MGRYKYKYNEDIIIESDINIRDVKTFEEAKQLAEDFLDIVEEYGRDKELYYDCTDPDIEEPDMTNDPFVIVDLCCRVPLKLLEKQYLNEEGEVCYIKEYLRRVKSVFVEFQDKYNELLEPVIQIFKYGQEKFAKQFVILNDDRYDLYKKVYHDVYIDKIGEIAEFWADKRQEYDNLCDRNDENFMSTVCCATQEEGTIFNIGDL